MLLNLLIFHRRMARFLWTLSCSPSPPTCSMSWKRSRLTSLKVPGGSVMRWDSWDSAATSTLCICTTSRLRSTWSSTGKEPSPWPTTTLLLPLLITGIKGIKDYRFTLDISLQDSSLGSLVKIKSCQHVLSLKQSFSVLTRSCNGKNIDRL